MLRSVSNMNDIHGLREMFDRLELNISNLEELKVNVSTYGSLLIAIIFDRIPDDLRIKISLKFGEDDWKLEETMEIIKEQLEARERSLVISCNEKSLDDRCFSAHSLQISWRVEVVIGKIVIKIRYINLVDHMKVIQRKQIDQQHVFSEMSYIFQAGVEMLLI